MEASSCSLHVRLSLVAKLSGDTNVLVKVTNLLTRRECLAQQVISDQAMRLRTNVKHRSERHFGFVCDRSAGDAQHQKNCIELTVIFICQARCASFQES
jgi:hypothetical protein